jgi:hypothetical protein
MRDVINAYLTRHAWPWFEAHIEPWRIVDRFRYRRAMVVYWACAIERPKRRQAAQGVRAAAAS